MLPFGCVLGLAMMSDCCNREDAENRSLLNYQGIRTAELVNLLQVADPIPVGVACDELKFETPPFNERLSAYISKRFGVDDCGKSARACLREASKRKSLNISSANLSQWLGEGKWELSLGPQTLFKLCLAMELDVEEGKAFAYSCLHQTWLNYRVAREAIYLFFIEAQKLFGDEAFSRACEVSSWADEVIAEYRDSTVKSASTSMEASGYTRVIADSVRTIAQEDNISAKQALIEIRRFIERNLPAFMGIQKSAIRVYDEYFSEGAFGTTPLTQLYKEATGLTLPRSGYLDNSYFQEDRERKRLLWGTVNRRDWVKRNGSDVDILNKRDILMEEHAVGKMRESGILRGNIIALLFFHFCFEQRERFRQRGVRAELFQKFYDRVNTTITEECGMMPLHPRKPFDALFMKSIAHSEGVDPITYLNHLLEGFYA